MSAGFVGIVDFTGIPVGVSKRRRKAAVYAVGDRDLGTSPPRAKRGTTFSDHKEMDVLGAYWKQQEIDALTELVLFLDSV